MESNVKLFIAYGKIKVSQITDSSKNGPIKLINESKSLLRITSLFCCYSHLEKIGRLLMKGSKPTNGDS